MSNVCDGCTFGEFIVVKNNNCIIRKNVCSKIIDLYKKILKKINLTSTFNLRIQQFQLFIINNL